MEGQVKVSEVACFQEVYETVSNIAEILHLTKQLHSNRKEGTKSYKYS